MICLLLAHAVPALLDLIDFPKEIVPSESNLSSGTFHFAIAMLLGELGKMVGVWWRDQRVALSVCTMHNTSATSVLKLPKDDM